MKSVLSSVLALLCGALVLPFWGGLQAQAAFEEMAAGIEEASKGLVTAELDFRRGWLRSSATTRIAGRTTGSPDGGLTLEHEIVHGPVPLGLLLRGELPTQLVQGIVDTSWSLPVGAEPVLLASLRTAVALDGFTRFDFESPAYEDEDLGLRWDGAAGTFLSPSPELTRLTGLLEAPGLVLAPAGAAGPGLALRDLAIDVDTEGEARPGLPIGRVGVSMGELAVRDESGGMRAVGLAWGQTSGIGEADTYQVTLTSGVDQLLLDPDRQYGPGALEIVVRNLDLDALEALGGAADAAQLDPAVLAQLLAPSPQIEIVRLELQGLAGTLEATGRLGIDGGSPQLAMGPVGALMAIDGEADVFVPTRLLHRLLDTYAATSAEVAGAASPAAQEVAAVTVRTRWIQAATAAGLLLVEEQGYRVRIEYTAGGLRVNGRPFDPASLQTSQVVSL